MAHSCLHAGPGLLSSINSENSSMKANRREDELVTCGPGSPQDSHCCQSCGCSLPTGVPQEAPRRAHVVHGPQKDTRQLLSVLSAPPAPFQHLGWGLRVPDCCSQSQDTASLYGVMRPFPAAQDGHSDRAEFCLHPESLVEIKRMGIEYRNSPTVGIRRTGNGGWRHSVPSFPIAGNSIT